MKLARHIKILIFAVLAVPLSAVAISATEAMATIGLNVRSGPGSGYSIVDTLAPNEIVNLTECRTNNWCYVTHAGPDGWVNSNYLTAAPDVSPPEPNCRFRLVFTPGGKPSFELVCGDTTSPWAGPFPGPTSATNRACFYDGPNYTGEFFCRTIGVYNTLPPVANDRITSVQVFGNARVRLCERQNMGPFCRDVTHNEAQLGKFLNNKVSSLRVYTGTLPVKKQVCLFDGPNYTGQYMCFGKGTITLPPAAQNRATSVRLFGASGVRLCKNATYCIGPANNVTTNVPMLAPFWNNQTSSIRVY
jgi:hypothetical protein